MTVQVLLILINYSCTDRSLNSTFFIDHAQGEMTGEVTSSSAILQSRLTLGNKFIKGDLRGAHGVACFELSQTFDFENSFKTSWLNGTAENDFIIKCKVKNLQPGIRYYFRLLFGPDTAHVKLGSTCTFRTHESPYVEKKCTFVVVTGMHYYYFHYGRKSYQGPDKHLGYPALKNILDIKPDFFIGTGDNVYYDEPTETPAQTKEEIREKYHEQFFQSRFIKLFSQVPTYWEKDDHDYRFNDSDPHTDYDRITKRERKDKPPWGPSHEVGVAMFMEQLPVVDPQENHPVTYRTHPINRLLQIWFVEGRDYRSPNDVPDSSEKTIWGEEQKKWLKRTLLESKAIFKILISPTPLVGPDDVNKSDNHTNPKGFRYEGDAFFSWLKDNGFLKKNFYLICGDRHWQYHATHPSGFEEFSCGAIMDENARLGRKPGDPISTDPEANVKQHFLQKEASGGFLTVTVEPGEENLRPDIIFNFYDENGILLYKHQKIAISNESN
jgi:alkaline phosphatase D